MGELQNLSHRKSCPIFDFSGQASNRNEQFGMVEGEADGGMTVAFYSRGAAKGFDEPELRLRVTREGWSVAGGTDAAVARAQPFTRHLEGGSLTTAGIVAVFFGYGASGFILTLAGVVACVMGCACCKGVKRKAEAGARRAAATGLGRGVVKAMTRAGEADDGGGGSSRSAAAVSGAAVAATRVVVDEHGVRRLVREDEEGITVT